MKNTNGSPASDDVCDHAGLRGNSSMAEGLVQLVRTSFQGIGQNEKPMNQIPAMVPDPQLVVESCPAQNKHFFCGTAKKFGCHFCAAK